MKRLAIEFNVTPVLLSELCRRYEIPTPAPGYWTKREMGKPTVKPDLGPAPAGLGGPITIPTATTVEWQSAETIHPRVVPTYDALMAAIPAEGMVKCRGVGLFSVQVAPSSADRATRLLSRLLSAAEASGWVVGACGKSLGLRVDGEPVRLELKEQTDRVPHALTEAEQQAVRRYAAMKPGPGPSGYIRHLWAAPKVAKWDRVPNGRLTLKLDADQGNNGRWQNFSDVRAQRLEQRLATVIRALAVQATHKKRTAAIIAARKEEARIQQQAASLAAAEAERQQRLAARQRALESRRLALLKSLLASFEEASRIDGLVAAVRAAHGTNEAVDAFAAWAEEYGASLRRGASLEALSAELQRLGLMEELSDGS